MGAAIQEGLQAHISFLRKVNGTRLTFFDDVGIPKGWVVDARIHHLMWEHVKANVIPLKPQDSIFGIRLGAAQKAQEYLEEKQKHLGPSAFLIAVRHEGTIEGWMIGAIRYTDLSKSPDTLLHEMAKSQKEGDTVLARSLEVAYVAKTGISDLS